MNPPTDGPARLEYYICERLAVLHMTRVELARRGGPNRSTLHKSSNGSRSMSLSTLTRLDQALGWAHGSSRAILEGGVPKTPPPQDTHVRTVLHAVEGLIEQCHAMLADARQLLTELLAGADTAEHAR
ncbi:helix-turn-helix domain-containing protein [Mycobacterium kansasii]|uniref:helix-turn-helix domain-containing protein n=1 Tax=Mycobacterium kansasii TaxID=1768 RepID=UPI0004D86CB2|nr:helix-turn-helix transcriptional regulator [Mycobacterium kansasii]KEP38797.1 RNA polymerase sigma-70 factor [Mycobacterium kansasii]